MKTVFLGLLAFLAFSSASLAASDYLLEIEGIKGESKQSKRCPDGACTISFSNLKPGSYKLTVTGPDGKKHESTIEVMSWSFGSSNAGSMAQGSGMGSGRVASSSGAPPTKSVTTSDVAVSTEVKAPRDVATGQASGKRQHGYVIMADYDNNTTTLQPDVATARACCVGKHIKNATIMNITVDNEHGTVQCDCSHM